MALKVFKIPDGKGGVTYQVQTPDGQWQETDKDGNLLQKEEAPVNVSIPKAKTKRAKTGKEVKDENSERISLRVRKEDFDRISRYVSWRGVFYQRVLIATFIVQAALDVIGKDKEYKEFLKQHNLLP